MYVLGNTAPEKVGHVGCFYCTSLFLKYHLYSNSKSSQLLPKIKEAKGSNFPSPFLSARVTGSPLQAVRGRKERDRHGFQ